MHQRHPVHQLVELLSTVEPYPQGMVPAPRQLARTAFFPGGYGLWGAQISASLPAMPVGGIMVVGSDFHCEAGYERASRSDGENLNDPTWRNLLQLLKDSGIPPTHCFFTNLIMGLRKGDKPCGKSPGFRDAGFFGRCVGFFGEQLWRQRPRVVVAMGMQVINGLGCLSEELQTWRRAKSFANLDSMGASVASAQVIFNGEKLRINFAGLTHPCMRGSNVHRRRYKGLIGDEAEKRILREVVTAGDEQETTR